MFFFYMLMPLSAGYDLDSLRARVDSGQQYYVDLASQGECWYSVLVHMTNDCPSLTEHLQHVYASQLTQCHLTRLNLAHETCFASGNCENIEWRAFTAYTTYFPHVFDICVYLNFAKWQAQTKTLVNSLHNSSQEALSSLQQTLSGLDTIQVAQGNLQTAVDSGLVQQRELNAYLIENQEKLDLFVVNFMKSAQSIHEELRDQQLWMQEWLGTVQSSVKEIQLLGELLVGEVLDIKSIVFYCVFIGVTFIVTASPEAIQARPKLLWAVCLQLVFENLMFSYIPRYRHYATAGKVLFVIGSGIYLVYVIQSYRNYDKLSYNMLKVLVHRLKNSRVSGSNVPTPSSLSSSTPYLMQIPEVYQCLESDHRRPRRNTTDNYLAHNFRRLNTRKNK